MASVSHYGQGLPRAAGGTNWGKANKWGTGILEASLLEAIHAGQKNGS